MQGETIFYIYQNISVRKMNVIVLIDSYRPYLYLVIGTLFWTYRTLLESIETWTLLERIETWTLFERIETWTLMERIENWTLLNVRYVIELVLVWINIVKIDFWPSSKTKKYIVKYLFSFGCKIVVKLKINRRLTHTL